jgi:hypothetical protein
MWARMSDYPGRPVAGRPPRAGAGAGYAANGLLFALLLAGCRAPSPVQPARPDQAPPATSPIAPGSAAAPDWHLDAGDSGLTVLAFREGPLARLGHNHVLRFGSLSGSAGDAGDVRFTLRLPLAAIVLDDATDRLREGADFASAPTADDVEGTYRNLTGERVLDAARSPAILVEGRCAAPCDGETTIDLAIEVAGRRTAHVMPVNVARGVDGVVVTVSRELAQTALGIAPFSVAMGSLRVRDALVVRCRLVFRRG